MMTVLLSTSVLKVDINTPTIHTTWSVSFIVTSKTKTRQMKLVSHDDYTVEHECAEGGHQDSHNTHHVECVVHCHF